MKSLIEINPDFKRVVAALNRIAAAIETHVLHAHGVRIQPPSKSELEGEDAGEPLYSTDEDTLKRELEAARREIEQTDEAGLVK